MKVPTGIFLSLSLGHAGSFIHSSGQPMKPIYLPGIGLGGMFRTEITKPLVSGRAE